MCACVCKHYISGVTESLFWGDKRGWADIRRGVGGLEDGMQCFFSHHIYCAQSKCKWGVGGAMGAHGVNGGGGMAPIHPPPPHSYTTALHNYISYKCMFFFT